MSLRSVKSPPLSSGPDDTGTEHGELYRQIVEQVSEGIFVLEPDGRMSYVNPRFEAMIGRPAGELLQQPLVSLLDPVHMAGLLDCLDESIAARENRQVEMTWLRRADGGQAPVKVVLSPQLDGEGEVMRIVGLLHDASLEHERSQAWLQEQGEMLGRLQRSERFLAGSIETIKRRSQFMEAMLEVGRRSRVDQEPEETVRSYLQAFHHLFTYEHARILRATGHPIRLMPQAGPGTKDGSLSPDDHPMLFSALNESRVTVLSLLDDEPDYQPMNAASHSAVIIPLTASEVPVGLLQVESNQPDQFPADEVALLDLFASRLALEIHNQELYNEIQRWRAYQESIVEQAGSGVFILNEAACVVSMNSAAETLVGQSRMRQLTRPFQECLQADRNVEAVRALFEAIASTQPVSGLEFTLSFPGGRETCALVNLVPLTFPGRDVEFIVTAHDISRLRQLENQVVQADKLASLGQMAAGLAHELGNPVTYIASHAQLLQAGEKEESRRQRIDKILEASARIESLISNLLSYARPGNPRDRVRIDVGSLIDQTLALLEYPLRRSGATIEKEVACPAPQISANRGMMQQMLINLVENALHAVEGGEGRVKISAGVADGGMVQITVEDNGAGISRDDLTRIFTPFFTTKPEGKGTGMGLAIVHQIVTGHSGRIAVKSVPGEGTRFRILFPACD